MTRPTGDSFRIEEATIADLHQAIRDGRTTCAAVVQQYIDRVRAYNGVSSMLVTEDGKSVPEAPGVTRAKAAVRFPTETVKASTILPDLDKYRGPPLEFGRMEPTASDPSVQQQFGMIVGIPKAGQLNAIGTLNIRGERSVTCWGEFDKHPSLGPLPPWPPPELPWLPPWPPLLWLPPLPVPPWLPPTVSMRSTVSARIATPGCWSSLPAWSSAKPAFDLGTSGS